MEKNVTKGTVSFATLGNIHFFRRNLLFSQKIAVTLYVTFFPFSFINCMKHEQGFEFSKNIHDDRKIKRNIH